MKARSTGTQTAATAAPSRLNLSLMENAVTFFQDALSNAIAAEEKPVRWKFAILSLVQAIELSLKALLAKPHPFFIYTDIDKRQHTVSLNLAISRLEHIANVKLSDDESKALKVAVEVRNDIVHHQIDAELPKLKLAFARLLGFLNEFHRSHFQEALQDQVDAKLWQSGVEIQDYGDELFRRAQERMKNDGITGAHLVTCPKCRWRALCGSPPMSNTCYVCGHTEDLYVCDFCQRILFAGEQRETDLRISCFECDRFAIEEQNERAFDDFRRLGLI